MSTSSMDMKPGGILEVPKPLSEEQVRFFNGYLLHRSKKNRSGIYRRVLVNHCMNAWSLLPWWWPAGNEKQAPAPASQLDVRNVVHVAGIDPYAWKGCDKPPRSVWLRTCKANTPPPETK